MRLINVARLLWLSTACCDVWAPATASTPPTSTVTASQVHQLRPRAGLPESAAAARRLATCA